MHYTAMVGTEYYNNGANAPPPDPMLPTPALIGIICGIVVIACCGLLYAGLRCSMQRIAEGSNKGKRRLVVDLVFFDGEGRMLVDVNGQVPSKEVLSNIQFKVSFTALFDFLDLGFSTTQCSLVSFLCLV
jgi:hypothetical protein